MALGHRVNDAPRIVEIIQVSHQNWSLLLDPPHQGRPLKEDEADVLRVHQRPRPERHHPQRRRRPPLGEALHGRGRNRRRHGPGLRRHLPRRRGHDVEPHHQGQQMPQAQRWRHRRRHGRPTTRQAGPARRRHPQRLRKAPRRRRLRQHQAQHPGPTLRQAQGQGRSLQPLLLHPGRRGHDLHQERRHHPPARRGHHPPLPCRRGRPRPDPRRRRKQPPRQHRRRTRRLRRPTGPPPPRGLSLAHVVCNLRARRPPPFLPSFLPSFVPSSLFR
mmetsp:Transcript_33469/g.106875  ORF Transcript_33469/g.106875 Transcript_33469/m.106875 type:complete len:273 (-) Transcript_33469:29-847(-)